MNIHYIQHVPFEGIGAMERHFLQNGHRVTQTRLYTGQSLPSIAAMKAIDALIVMGGPMNVNDEQHYPWLSSEKRWLENYLNQHKKVLGICLGAQIIAQILGASIGPNLQPEIGWFPIFPREEVKSSFLGEIFSKDYQVFHWHGDTFDIPHGAVPIAYSEACENQGFLVDDNILGLQFHIETTPASATKLIEHCRDDLISAPYIQNEHQILSQSKAFQALDFLCAKLLNQWHG